MRAMARYSAVALTLLAGTAMAQTSFSVDRFTSHKAWNANSWILESDSGLVLIDGQMLKSDARRLAAVIKSYEKPLAAVIVSHPHPDHFLGIAELRRQLGEFEVIGSTQSGDHFESSHAQFMGWAKDVYGDDAEEEIVPLSRSLERSSSLTLAGIPLQIELAGPGESPDHLLIYQPDQKLLFTGDVTMHHSHHYVGEGRSAAMLTQLRHLKTKYADASQLLPGHGDPGRIGVVDDLIEYVEDLQSVFWELAAVEANRVDNQARLTDEARRAFVDRVASKYPNLTDYNLPLPQLLAMNLAGLEREMLTPSNPQAFLNGCRPDLGRSLWDRRFGSVVHRDRPCWND